MPKISRHAGATNAGAAVPPTSAAAPGQTEEGAVLWHCLDCTTAYAVGSPACPHCASTRRADQPAAPEPAQAPAEDEQAPGLPPAQEEGGEQSSPGNSSSASTPKPEMSSEPTPQSRPSRARKTANRSKKAPTESPSVSGTAGGQTDRTSAPDAPGEGEPGGE